MRKNWFVRICFLKINVFFLTSAVFGQSGEIPVEFVGDRMFAKLGYNGVEARMLIDTGGNTGIYPEFTWYWKSADTLSEKGFFHFKKNGPFKVAPFFPYDILQKDSLRIIGQDEESTMMRKVLGDGVWGHGWFGGRKWRISYPEKKLELLEKIQNPRGKKVALGFKDESLFYPRFQVVIDGESHEMLFDTGATSFFSNEAMAQVGIVAAFSASNFIRNSVFESWKKKHPDWTIVEGGDRMGNHPIIRVPEIEIAGKKIGPLWFARRPDSAYDEFMAAYMDCKCAGAIGGTALKAFKSITLDYPAKSAWFD